MLQPFKRLRLPAALAAAALVTPTFAFAKPETTDCTGTAPALRACTTAPGAAVLLSPAPLPASAEARWVSVVDGREGSPVERSGGAVLAPDTVGIWRHEQRTPGQDWVKVGPDVITQVHHDGRQRRLNGYSIGRHAGQGRTGEYAPPAWFIEVTRENQDYAVSESFRLGQFLTKNQAGVWPKYVPLNLALVQKLELIAEELRREGFPARRIHVMSGYRTPEYNGPGGKGRAKLSRHTYGDAADVWVDDDEDGVMDDLNRDGQSDDRDAEFLAALAERVGDEHPALAGGAGIYKANRHHGPFTHVDVRGRPARWSLR